MLLHLAQLAVAARASTTTSRPQLAPTVTVGITRSARMHPHLVFTLHHRVATTGGCRTDTRPISRVACCPARPLETAGFNAQHIACTMTRLGTSHVQCDSTRSWSRLSCPGPVSICPGPVPTCPGPSARVLDMSESNRLCLGPVPKIFLVIQENTLDQHT